MDNFKFERRVSVLTAVAVVAVVLFLVIRDRPFSDANNVVLIRIVFALAVGTLGATIPGFLSVDYNAAGFTIRAAGALALFVITFFGTPRVEALHLVDGLRLQEEITRHLANRNNCTTALNEANKLAQMFPKDAVAQNLRGNALYCIQDISGALKAFEAAEALDPGYRPARYNRAAALVRLGKYEQAEPILRDLVAKDDDYISARYNLAVAQAALQNFQNAAQNFEMVFQKDRGFDASLGLGFSYLLRNDAEKSKSLEYFQIAISQKPAAVCFLFGKLPYDIELHEERPYLDILRFVEKSGDFFDVRSHFDGKYKDAVCQSSALQRGKLIDIGQGVDSSGRDHIFSAQYVLARCCEGPR